LKILKTFFKKVFKVTKNPQLIADPQIAKISFVSAGI